MHLCDVEFSHSCDFTSLHFLRKIFRLEAVELAICSVDELQEFSNDSCEVLELYCEVEFEIEEAVANDDECWTASTSETKDMGMEVIVQGPQRMLVGDHAAGLFLPEEQQQQQLSASEEEQF
jgi:hypothetical protein